MQHMGVFKHSASPELGHLVHSFAVELIDSNFLTLISTFDYQLGMR